MTTTAETKAVPFMGTVQVADATGATTATVRSWIWRKARGKSAPAHPSPAGKINGGWVWESAEVQRFLDARTEGGVDVVK